MKDEKEIQDFLTGCSAGQDFSGPFSKFNGS